MSHEWTVSSDHGELWLPEINHGCPQEMLISANPSQLPLQLNLQHHRLLALYNITSDPGPRKELRIAHHFNVMLYLSTWPAGKSITCKSGACVSFIVGLVMLLVTTGEEGRKEVVHRMNGRMELSWAPPGPMINMEIDWIIELNVVAYDSCPTWPGLSPGKAFSFLSRSGLIDLNAERRWCPTTVLSSLK